jgi:hypothetical protein
VRATPILVALLLVVCACSSGGPTQASVSPGGGHPTSSAAPSPSPSAHPTSSAAPSPLPSAHPTAPVTPTPLAPIADSAVDQLLARCPTLAELVWVDSIEALTFTSDPSAGRIVCSAAQGSRDLTLLQERVYQAVLLFSWIRFDLALPWTDEELDAWLAHAIHGVDFRDDTQSSFCCEAGGVIVVQTNNLWVLTASSRGEIWQATLSLAALFAHEARHNEGYGHTCGPNDQTVAELGSWGLQYYFLLWVGTHSDPSVVSEPFRTAAARTAAGMGRFFCQPPAELVA